MKLFKKLIFILCFCFFVSNQIFAQSLMHSFGLTISALFGTIKDNNSSSSFALKQTNITYFPRFNFIENENSSVSIGLPVGVGFGLVSDTYGDGAAVLFSYDLPVALDYNIGCKSTPDNEVLLEVILGLALDIIK